MAIALVQNSAAITATASNTLPSNSTLGNLLVAFVCIGSSVTPPSGWSSGLGDSGGRTQLFYYENNPGGLSSFTFTNAIYVVVAEFSGVATVSSLDTSGGTDAASSPLTIATAGNVSVANSLAVGAVGDAESKAGTTTLALGSMTNIINNNASSLSNHLMANYQLNPATGSTFSPSGSTSTMNLTWLGGSVAVFKPASSIVNAPITQVAATLTFTGGTQTINTSFVGKDVQNGNNNFGAIIMQAINRGSTY